MKLQFLKMVFLLNLLLASTNFTQVAESRKSILDYYFPETNNKSTFTYLSNGKQIEMQKVIWFIKDNSNTFETLEKNTINGNIGSIVRNVFRINKNKLEIVKTISNSALSPGQKIINHNPPEVFLELPQNGKITKWKYESSTGDIYECEAKMINLNVYEEDKVAIVVHKKLISNGKYHPEFSTFEYYVEGLGLLKTQNKDNIDSMILLEQTYDESVQDYYKTQKK